MGMEDASRAPGHHSRLFFWLAGEGSIWERLIEPHPDLRRPAARRRSRLLSAVMLPLVPALAALMLALEVLRPPIDPAALLAIRAVGFSLLILYTTAYILSRTTFHEWGAYTVVTATELGAWLLIALAAGTQSVGLLAAFLVIGVLLAAVFLNIEAVIAIASMNALGTLLLPFIAGLDASSLFLLFFFQAIAYPFMIASSWVRRRDLATIETQALEIETVLDSIPDTVLSMDPGMRLMGANRGARTQMNHWFGAEPDRGVMLQGTLPTSVVVSLERALHRADTEGRVGFDIKQLDTEDGLRDLEFIVNPMRTQDGVNDGYVVLVSDMTDRNAALALERKAYEQSVQIDKLEEINRFKTQLLNTASHELRTPLTPIRLQLGVLKQDRKSPLAAHHLHAVEVLERNTLRLERLVRDILDVARIESDQLKLTMQPLDLFSLVRDEVEGFTPVAEEVGVTLQLEGDADASGFTQGDVDRLGQVLGNLLANAVKFADGGTVKVRYREKDDRLRVEVDDNGLGMDPEAIDRLFRPFTQIHDETHQARGGSGLGLYICKGIIEGHHGAIHARSDGIGKGSRFWFEIPRTDDSDASSPS